jgi:hypothetical protein
MFQTPKRFGRAAIATASICTLTALASCQPTSQAGAGGKTSAEAEYQQARQQYARAAERLAKEAKPTTDRAALAKRLNLTAERFGVIKTGAQVTGAIVLAFDQGSDCKMGHCTCVGDRDCNEMFSGICRSPSTDGSCEGSGDLTICTCEYSAGVRTGLSDGQWTMLASGSLGPGNSVVTKAWLEKKRH